MVPVCNNCKFLQDVNREVAPDRGWCPMWQKWQKITAPECRFFEQREYIARKNRQYTRPNPHQTYR